MRLIPRATFSTFSSKSKLFFARDVSKLMYHVPPIMKCIPPEQNLQWKQKQTFKECLSFLSLCLCLSLCLYVFMLLLWGVICKFGIWQGWTNTTTYWWAKQIVNKPKPYRDTYTQRQIETNWFEVLVTILLWAHGFDEKCLDESS
jgi:hypothetical protein